ncbi:hypothetical protein SAZ11_03060 [Streptomyces sp. FXJ1.4098]|nr:hypothetical protein [Streptomyces sp. FXJ1.4098]
MAEIVAVAGVPHTPVFPSPANGDTVAGAEVARRYAAADEVLARAGAEVFTVLTCDHINTFTPDPWPTLAVATGDSAIGPNDDVPGAPRRRTSRPGTSGRYRTGAWSAGTSTRRPSGTRWTTRWWCRCTSSTSTGCPSSPSISTAWWHRAPRRTGATEWAACRATRWRVCRAVAWRSSPAAASPSRSAARACSPTCCWHPPSGLGPDLQLEDNLS